MSHTVTFIRLHLLASRGCSRASFQPSIPDLISWSCHSAVSLSYSLDAPVVFDNVSAKAIPNDFTFYLQVPYAMILVTSFFLSSYCLSSQIIIVSRFSCFVQF